MLTLSLQDPPEWPTFNGGLPSHSPRMADTMCNCGSGQTAQNCPCSRGGGGAQ